MYTYNHVCNESPLLSLLAFVRRKFGILSNFSQSKRLVSVAAHDIAERRRALLTKSKLFEMKINIHD